MVWETVIGLEVHAQLATKSKIFSGAATHYGASANAQACEVDLALPGTLPVLNKKVLDMAITFGLAVNANIPAQSIFARKNYFYPDLPKGYQISQFDSPIVQGGCVSVLDENHTVHQITLTRAHLEEDAGKSIHHFHGSDSGIDLNRAGTPLLEIVSEPVMHSPLEAVQYLKALHTLVRHLGICDGNMQEGSFRCDANISIRPKGSKTLGTRVEIKNLNSFRFVEKALQYEINRQIEALEAGETLVQETRLYDSNTDETRPMRDKEEANDYRYFPDPDLLPVQISAEQLQSIRQSLPELPVAKEQRFVAQHQLRPEDASVLVQDPTLSGYFEATLALTQAKPSLIANWLLGNVLGALHKSELSLSDCPISPKRLGALLDLLETQSISSHIAKTVFEKMWTDTSDPNEIIEKAGLVQVNDSASIIALIQTVLDSHPEQLRDYRAGKEKLFGFFVGQVMKQSKGQANPEQVNELLSRVLNDVIRK